MSVNTEQNTDGEYTSVARWGTLVIVIVVALVAFLVVSVVNGSRSPNPQLSAPAQAP